MRRRAVTCPHCHGQTTVYEPTPLGRRFEVSEYCELCGETFVIRYRVAYVVESIGKDIDVS